MQKTALRNALLLAGAYAFFALLWHFTAPWLLTLWRLDGAWLARAEAAKDLLFALLSGLFWLLAVIWLTRPQAAGQPALPEQRQKEESPRASSNPPSSPRGMGRTANGTEPGSGASTHNRARYLFENSPVSLWEEDFSQVHTYVHELLDRGITNLALYLELHPEVLDECARRIRVLDVNRSTLRLYGARNKADLLGDLDHILSGDGRQLLKKEILTMAKDDTEFESQGVNYTLDSKRLDVFIRWSVIPGFEADFSRVVVSAVDVTDRLRMEEQLRNAEARFRLLVEQVSAAIYSDRVDEESSNIYTSPHIEVITGYTAEEWSTLPNIWFQSIHPEDFERVKTEHDRTNHLGEPFEMEYRLVGKDGRIAWVRDQAVLRWDRTLQCAVWQGFLLDITQMKTAEAALRESEARFRTLLQLQGEGTILFDLQGRLEYVNPAAEELFGARPGQMAGRHLTDFMTEASAQSILQIARESEGGRSFSTEVAIVRLDGGQRILLVTVTPTQEEMGLRGGGLAVCRDITARKHDETRLRYQSTHDTVTGLFNRAYFDDYLSRQVSSGGYPISLVMIDVDGLKQVNDHYGHPVGDELLRRVSFVLRSIVRSADSVARIGGDEFALLLPGADDATAQTVMSRLEDQLAAVNQTKLGHPIDLSFGTATAASLEEMETLVQAADQAMYQQKQAKRARKSGQPIS